MNAQKGVLLRERLRKDKNVIRLENHLFSEGGYRDKELMPTDMIRCLLREPSDTVKVKEFADAHHLVWEKNKYPYMLRMTSKTQLSRYEILNLICEKLKPKDCWLSWEYDDFIWQTFTLDPYIDRQWGLYNRDNLTIPKDEKYTDLGVGSAWNYCTGMGVNICVIDYGANLGNRDIHSKLIKCYDASGGSDTVTVDDGHGTACAAIACAIRNNNFGISGVAPDSSLMFARIDKSKGFAEIVSQIADAINWATDNGADVISMSLGIEPEKISYVEEITTAIKRATSSGRKGKGCVFVNAAGNEKGKVTYPGTVDGVIAVGSVDLNIALAHDSGSGAGLFCVAPGVGIYAPVSYSSYQYLCGTSYACPAVAGVAALVLEAYPDAKASQVNDIIARTSYLPEGEEYSGFKTHGMWSPTYGYGMVNAYEAVKRALMLARPGWIVRDQPAPYLSEDDLK